MSRSILVIDDEPRLAQSLAALLRGVGYEVRAAIGGVEGLAKVQQEDFDLVITDLRMDGVDGFEILQYLSAHKPKTALIVITGHASTESAIEAIHQKVYDYIPKPFDFELLKGSVEKVFAKLETEQLKADLAHMLSHDIKVPLTSIIGFAEFLTQPDGSPHPKQAEYARKIMANGQRMIALLDNYLTNARVEEGRLEIQRQRVSLTMLATEALRMMEAEFRARQISATSEAAEDVLIEGDEALLFRAIGNLLSNAAKYAPANSRVWIRSEKDSAGAAMIVVGNSGATIKQEECPALFERYRRGRSSRGTSGLGLGLHIVRCVCEAHGGKVEAIVDPATTSIEFRMTIPG